jgi:hypothetical protein
MATFSTADWLWLEKYAGDDARLLELRELVLVKGITNPPEALLRHLHFLRRKKRPVDTNPHGDEWTRNYMKRRRRRPGRI